MEIKVIYITGQAYSGSTFLCALLGTHPQMVPVSELSKWTKKFERARRHCACGKTEKECEFWCAVEALWLGQDRLNSLRRYQYLQNKFESISSLWKTSFVHPSGYSADFREFTDMTIALFRSIATVSGASTIVDSSKKPARGMALSRMKGLDVSFVHLIRSGPRYLESSLKRGRKISLNDPILLYKAFQLGVSWSTMNIVAEWIMSVSKARGIRIRYEDLVSQPRKTLGTVASALDIDLSTVQEHVEMGRPISYGHMATGSIHRRNGAKPLTREFNTVEHMDRRLISVFYLGSALCMRRYGYL